MSVRFFKRLITAVTIVLILTGAFFSGFYHAQTVKQAEEYDKTIAEMETYIANMESFMPTADNIAADGDIDAADTDGDSDSIVFESPYADKYPDFYAPQDYCAVESTDNTIYLTFDDGPSVNTDRILQVLADENVRATFFVVGQSSAENQQRMRDIVNAGHTIGMHTFSHNYHGIYASVDAYLDDMYLIYNQIREVTGTVPTVFRFPGGSINAYNGAIYEELISEMVRRGFVPFDWNVSSQDAAKKKLTAEEITANIVNGVGTRTSRSVVLMHDSLPKDTTADSLRETIRQLKAAGYEFDSLMPADAPLIFGYRKAEI